MSRKAVRVRSSALQKYLDLQGDRGARNGPRQSIGASELELMLQLLAIFLTATFLTLICIVTFCRSHLS
jgi:hypothetical protein